MNEAGADRADAVIAAHLAAAARARGDFFSRRQAVLREAARKTAQAIAGGGKLLLCASGEDQFLAREIAAIFYDGQGFERPPLPAVALSCDAGPECEDMFARQAQALGARGDALLAVTTAAKDAQIARALEAAASLGIFRIIFCSGAAGAWPALALCVPAGKRTLAREILLEAAHLYARLIDYYLFENVGALSGQDESRA